MTDVEASTRQWLSRPDSMSASIDRHYAVLDAVIAAHGGFRPVEQGEGDSLVAVFRGAVDAIVAAAEVQRALAKEIPELRVRVAVHTGEARLGAESTYVGPSIIRCARLRSCANGGQVLVSDTTAAVVRGELPEGVELVDLGTVKLRDLPGPERVWQLRAPDLEQDFPALRGDVRLAHNLPAPRTSLVGREDDVVSVTEMIERHRLVTVTGTGGSGKTRLALAVGHAAAGHHPGGTWWVDLADLFRGEQVPERVLQVLGAVAPPGRDPVPLITDRLASSPDTLLLLDNAEHVIDTVSELVDAVLAACPSVRFLVTSREPLAVVGETVVRATSLPDSSAVQLFTERATAVRPDLVLDDHAMSLIGAICDRLDGVPLAIELAAARVRHMTLAQVAGALDDAFRLLTGGPRTALPRHRTISASIAWSVDLLEPLDAVVFRRLAIFAGSFTGDAAGSVTVHGGGVDPAAVGDSLGRLVDRNLLQLDDRTGRYRLLETLKQWGVDALRANDELASTRAAHAAWCATWAEAVGALVHGIDPEPLLETAPDLRLAIDWATAEEPAIPLRIAAGLGRFLPILGHSGCDALARWILELDPSTVEPATWAAGIDGLALNAVLLDRPEIMGHVPRALGSLESARPATGLRFAMNMRDLLKGDYSVLEELAAEGVMRGDDLIAKWASAGAAAFAGAAGHRSVAHRHLEVLGEVVQRWQLDWTPATAGHGFGAAVDLATLEGRLGMARALAAWEQPRWDEHIFGASVHVAVAGYVCDDAAVLDVAAGWAQHEPPTLFRTTVHVAGTLHALRNGALDAAAEQAHAWCDGDPTLQVMRVMEITPIAVALLACGDASAVRTLFDRWSLDVEGYGGLPRPVASVHHLAALLALHEGRWADAADAAHALLEVSAANGFVVLSIDALLVLLQVARERGAATTAARLAGATTAVRAALGYRTPLVERPADVDALCSSLAEQHAEAYRAGEGLGLDGAIELARRKRGERGRPKHGWESLTPTEVEVTGLVALGLTNQEIGERLLITPKTAKTHLTSIFSKLGIHNRTELAAMHARRGAPPGQRGTDG
jgi:predicted ATPase/class 3 adenylate cyclase/DNA-binding CsgD family transcriptional regulator